MTKVASVTGSGGLYALNTDFSGQYVYAIDRLNTSAHVFGYAINMDSGALTAVPGSPYTIQDGYGVVASDGFGLSPTSGYLYVGAQSTTGQAYPYSVNFGTGALTLIGTQYDYVLDEVLANPQSILADNQARFLWAPTAPPTNPPEDGITEYTLTNGIPGNHTVISTGSLIYYELVEDASGKYLYTAGFDQNCTNNCTNVVTSYSIGANESLTQLSGPLSTGGTTANSSGTAVSRKSGD